MRSENKCYRVEYLRSAADNHKRKHVPSKLRRMKHHMRQIVFEAELKLASMSIYSNGEVYGPKAGKARKATVAILKTLRKCHANELASYQRKMEKLKAAPEGTVIPGLEFIRKVDDNFTNWLSKIVISHNRKC